MKTVMILGAGASKHAGAPVMKDFLSQARAINPQDNLFSKLLSHEMKSLLYSSSVNINNIEELFNLVEMGLLVQKFPGIRSDDLLSFRDSIKSIIVKTLEERVQYPYDKERYVIPHHSNAVFIENLLGLYDLKRDKINTDLSIISFNYDLSMDFALHFYNFNVNYCLENDTSGFKYIKLHGSINWGWCNKCNSITPYSFADFFRGKQFYPPRNEEQDTNIKIPISSQLHRQRCKHCVVPSNLDLLPFIVPPSWNKLEYGRILNNVWSTAANILGEADNIFIIGYSLPSTDSFFKYLLTLGLHGEKRINRFWIYNPDRDVDTNFQSLLGKGITESYKFPSYKDESLGYYENALADIHGILAEDINK